MEELSIEDKKSAFGEKHVSELAMLLEDGLRSFDIHCQSHPNAPDLVVEIENRGTEELSVVLPGHGYSIDLIATERKSFARTIITPAWQVTGYKVHLASRWHPEEVEDVPLSEHANHLDAVAAVIKSLLSEEVDRWIENRCEQLTGHETPW